jgi:hypothetical protein
MRDQPRMCWYTRRLHALCARFSPSILPLCLSSNSASTYRAGIIISIALLSTMKLSMLPILPETLALLP